MGRYSIISDAGKALAELLREHMVPELIANPDSIGLCSPSDNADCIVGIHLYDVSENSNYKSNTMTDTDILRQKYPSVYLTLSYMITVYFNGDIRFKAEEEQKILGRIIQVLNDYPVLDRKTLKYTENASGMDIKLTWEQLPAGDKMKLWSAADKVYKTSLFYKMEPVELESERGRSFSRVTDIRFRSEDVFGRKVSAAVIFTDAFSGNVITGNTVQVYLYKNAFPAKKAVLKQDGYHIFSDIEAGFYILAVRSDLYQQEEREIEIDGAGFMHIKIKLYPNRNYRFPSDTTIISGRTYPNAQLKFYDSFNTGSFRLLSDYEKNNDTMCIFHDNIIGTEEIDLLIFFKNRKDKFFITLGEMKDKNRYEYVVLNPLNVDLKKEDTVIIPVFSYKAGKAGECFVPLKDEFVGKERTMLYINSAAARIEKEIELKKNKNNFIDLF